MQSRVVSDLYGGGECAIIRSGGGDIANNRGDKMSIENLHSELRTLAAKHPSHCCGGNRRQPKQYYAVAPKDSEAGLLIANILKLEGYQIAIDDNLVYVKGKCKEVVNAMGDFFNRYLENN